MLRGTRKVIAVGLCLGIMVISSGCATILKGGSDKVSFGSDPDQSKVYLDGNYVGKTPTQLKLSSNKTYQVEFKKEGYETRVFILSNSIGVGWVIVDAIFGLIPVIVDAATGSWYYLDTDYFKANLEAK